jgi:hypothetical protein
LLPETEPAIFHDPSLEAIEYELPCADPTSFVDAGAVPVVPLVAKARLPCAVAPSTLTVKDPVTGPESLVPAMTPSNVAFTSAGELEHAPTEAAAADRRRNETRSAAGPREARVIRIAMKYQG